MLDILLAQLPSGLSTIDIGGSDEQWTQRAEYAFVLRTRSHTLQPSPKSATATEQRPQRPQPSVIEQLVRNIDGLFDIYNDSMKREAISGFIHKMREFIGENPGLALIGRKASREIMEFLTRTNERSPPDAFFKLCSFLLDANISANGRTYEWNNECKFTRTIHVKN